MLDETDAEVLTILDEAHHSPVLQSHVHVKVLNVNIEATNSLLVLLAFGFEIFADFEEAFDICAVLHSIPTEYQKLNTIDNAPPLQAQLPPKLTSRWHRLWVSTFRGGLSLS